MKIDRPIEKKEEDLFGTGQYVKALSKFIQDSVKEGATPLTLGIQGDWGSGKTSMLNLLKTELGEAYLSVDFNSWIFSNEQNIGSELILRAVDTVMEAAEKAKEKKLAYKLYQGMDYLFQVGWQMAEGFLRKRGIDLSYQRKKNMERTQFRSHFAQSVEGILQKTGKHALVLYIDDLDRVPPVKAIELTEAIKNFLDVRGCVFLIACDYRVIQKGLFAKFGFDEKSRESRQYLDKIFQIPFRMPVFQETERQKYVKDCFKGESFGDNEITTLDKIIATFQMDNPRTIKRIAGVYKLLCYVQQPQETIEKMNFLMLLILQQYSTALYQYLAQNEDTTELLALANKNGETLVLKDYEESEAILNKFLELLGNNDFVREWLEKKGYRQYFRLTEISDTGTGIPKPPNPRNWNTPKFKTWLKGLSDPSIRDFAFKILEMFEDLCKNFPSEYTKKLFPRGRAKVVYGQGYSPTVSIQVVQGTTHRRAITYYPDPKSLDAIRGSDGFAFFYWGKPENTPIELWEKTKQYFRNKLCPHIFSKLQKGCASSKDLINGDESLLQLKGIIREMMEVRIRPECSFTQEELQERLGK